MATKTLEHAPEKLVTDDKEARSLEALRLIDAALGQLTVDRSFVSVGDFTDAMLDIRNTLASPPLTVEELTSDAA